MIQRTLIGPRRSEELPEITQDEQPDMPLEYKGDEGYPDEYLPQTPNDIPDMPYTPEVPDIPQDYGLCPVIEDSQNTTTFYDLILTMTENEIYLTDEASFTLRTEMHRYINAYGACACPSSRVYFDDVYRLDSASTSSYPGAAIMRSFLRRQSRRLVSKGKVKSRNIHYITYLILFHPLFLRTRWQRRECTCLHQE